MIDPGLNEKVVLITGGNNPYSIGAALARAFASHGSKIFIHYFRQEITLPDDSHDISTTQETGLPFFFKQQRKTADEVASSIRKYGGEAESQEGDLSNPKNVDRLFDQAEKAFGHIDILVNNAAEYIADTFIPLNTTEEKVKLWEGGPTVSTIDVESHDRHFAVNSRAAAILMAKYAHRIIERQTN